MVADYQQQKKVSNAVHEQSVSLEPGWHKLTLIDQMGYQLQRWFQVLGEVE